MLLAIDADNTNTVFAVFDGDILRGQWRISTDGHRTADEYGVWLLQLLQMEGLKAADITAAICASVVPQTLFDLKTLCKRFFNTELRIIGEKGAEVPMKVEIERAQDLGADRLVNAYAAWRIHQKPLVVVDFGTATTFDVVSEKGAYIGGVIATGVQLSLEALERAAAKLPKITIQKPPRVIGQHTVGAMQSGIFYGYLGMIEGILTRIYEEQGGQMLTLATGGLAPFYASATRFIQHVEPDLTMNGLKVIYRHSQTE